MFSLCFLQVDGYESIYSYLVYTKVSIIEKVSVEENIFIKHGIRNVNIDLL